jgi:predicted transglutaminase-like cysteine proteinase
MPHSAPTRPPPRPRLSAWHPLTLATLAAVLAGGLLAHAVAWNSSALEAGARRHGPQALAALPSLLPLLAALPAGGPAGSAAATAHAAAEAERVDAVNRYFNQRLRFRSDRDAWGAADHWASPFEALARGHGDCEDYAIAKYSVLRAAGVAPARLRLVYVRAELDGPAGGVLTQPHMVLAYHARSGDEPLIMDNLRSDLLPASRRPDLLPVFSFNAEGLWQGTGPQTLGHPQAQLSRWRDVLQRIALEGF